MRAKKWAKHIIKRFGKDNARRYTKVIHNCPCLFLGWGCYSCQYSENGDMCQEGFDFYKKVDIIELKKKIRRKLKHE